MAKSPLTFRIFQGGKLVREETLAQTVIKLGKVPSAHLRIDDETVSRMHAILEVDAAGGISLIDLGSTRGTFVNGAKINKAKVADGDVITVGDTRIELTVAAAVAAPMVMPMPAAAVAPLPQPPAPSAWAAPPLPPPLPVAPRSTPAHSFLAAVPASPAQIAAVVAPTDEPGARAVEVAAMLGDSVVEVKHCMDPRGGKITRGTYAILGASLVCLATATASFVVGVGVASRNAAALETWTHVLHKPTHAFRAEQASGALDPLELGGLALGIAAAAAGLARARRERKSPYFRIGTAAGVELATESAPSASFPLVAPSGDDFVFNFAAGMDGEMIVAGASTPLAELVAAGRARPSQTVAGALEVPIPAAARIRARAGATTFLISAVAAPRVQPMAAFALDSRAALYAAASLVAHVGLYALASAGSANAASIGLDTPTGEDIAIRTNVTDHDNTPPPPPEPSDGDVGATTEGGGGRMALPEGAAGKPTATTEGKLQIQDNHQDNLQVARAEALAYAREAGVMGDTRALDAAITALGGTENISNGFDTSNYNGALYGAAGEGKGQFGMGRTGFDGVGGGCGWEDCRGIGTIAGRYNTIGTGTHAGNGFHIGDGHDPHGGIHIGLVPSVVISPPTAIGGLDKSIIKRYVKREQEKIAYCYESELLAHPNLEGDVIVQFFIAPDGSVQSAKGSGFSANVSSCVADVVHAISFPAPHDGGGVQVNYPFHFHMAAAH